MKSKKRPSNIKELSAAQIDYQVDQLRQYLETFEHSLTKKELLNRAIEWIDSKDFQPIDAIAILSIVSNNLTTKQNPKKRNNPKKRHLKEQANQLQEYLFKFEDKLIGPEIIDKARDWIATKNLKPKDANKLMALALTMKTLSKAKKFMKRRSNPISMSSGSIVVLAGIAAGFYWWWKSKQPPLAQTNIFLNPAAMKKLVANYSENQPMGSIC